MRACRSTVYVLYQVFDEVVCTIYCSRIQGILNEALCKSRLRFLGRFSLIG